MAVVCLESSLGGSGVSSSRTDTLILLTMCSSPVGLRRSRLLDLERDDSDEETAG
jgi:hypothetical protein